MVASARLLRVRWEPHLYSGLVCHKRLANRKCQDSADCFCQIRALIANKLCVAGSFGRISTLLVIPHIRHQNPYPHHLLPLLLQNTFASSSLFSAEEPTSGVRSRPYVTPATPLALL